MICYRKHFLRLAELWYDDPVPAGGADVLFFNQAPEPLPGIHWESKSTIIFDLTKSESELIAEMRRQDRVKIRNAKDKDLTICDVIEAPEPAARNRFYAFYDEFARAKGLPILARDHMEQMASLGMLVISLAHAPDWTASEDPLVYHASFVYKGRFRALYSSSVRLEKGNEDRLNLIGRANRLLHWEDMCWAKAKGLPIYDFGGWYAGTEDAQRLAINRFKEGFGGTRVTEFEAVHGATLLGRLGVAAWKLMKRP